MISSMTGFGAAEGMVGPIGVSVELRTVNHRFFNPSLKLPGRFSICEKDVREFLKQRIARGHVTLSVRIDREHVRQAAIDQERFGEYVALLRGMQTRHGLSESLDIATILNLPDVMVVQEADSEVGAAGELLGVVGDAVASLQRMREEEGARLAFFLLERLSSVQAAVARVADRAPGRLADQHTRLTRSVQELAGTTGIDPQRLAQEIAIIADRLDISEELERFAAHIAAFRQTIESDSREPVGKRLGFLLQELVREANTTGSKANDASIVAEVVAIKEELERMREQVENIE